MAAQIKANEYCKKSNFSIILMLFIGKRSLVVLFNEFEVFVK